MTTDVTLSTMISMAVRVGMVFFSSESIKRLAILDNRPSVRFMLRRSSRLHCYAGLNSGMSPTEIEDEAQSVVKTKRNIADGETHFKRTRFQSAGQGRTRCIGHHHTTSTPAARRCAPSLQALASTPVTPSCTFNARPIYDPLLLMAVQNPFYHI